MSQQMASVEQRESGRRAAIPRSDRILGVTGIAVGVASMAATGLILLGQTPGDTGASAPMGWTAFGLAVCHF